MTPEIVVFDTEFTAWAGSIARNWKGPGEHREIVQIGAVVVGAKEMNEKASFSVLIKPVQNPILSGYFEQLTRISNAQVQAEGVDFVTGVERFIAFAGTRPTYCYGRDDLIIAENAALREMPRLWTPAASVNLRVWLGEVGVPLAGVHAGELAAHVGAKARGLAHDALTDARSLVEAVRYLVARGAPNPFAGAAPGPS